MFCIIRFEIWMSVFNTPARLVGKSLKHRCVTLKQGPGKIFFGRLGTIIKGEIVVIRYKRNSYIRKKYYLKNNY